MQSGPGEARRQLSSTSESSPSSVADPLVKPGYCPNPFPNNAAQLGWGAPPELMENNSTESGSFHGTSVLSCLHDRV